MTKLSRSLRAVLPVLSGSLLAALLVLGPLAPAALAADRATAEFNEWIEEKAAFFEANPELKDT